MDGDPAACEAITKLGWDPLLALPSLEQFGTALAAKAKGAARLKPLLLDQVMPDWLLPLLLLLLLFLHVLVGMREQSSLFGPQLLRSCIGLVWQMYATACQDAVQLQLPQMCTCAASGCNKRLPDLPQSGRAAVSTRALAALPASPSLRAAAACLFAVLQSFCAGVGNWVADEVLWQARLHPEQLLSELQPQHVEALHAALQHVVQVAVAANADSSKFPEDWMFHIRWALRLPAITYDVPQFVARM